MAVARPVWLSSAERKRSAGNRVQRPDLDQFFGSFRDQAGLTILDLGGARQENTATTSSPAWDTSFYSEDFLRIFQSRPYRYFLRVTLDYPDDHFDGVLAWTRLNIWNSALLSSTADRLFRVLKPKGYLLAIFHSAERKQTVPCFTFRIQDPHTLQVSRYGERAASQQLFNNRFPRSRSISSSR